MEVVPGIHMVDGVNGNCYLLVGEGLTLIDTGMPRNAKRILAYVTDVLGRRPSDVRTIVLTHSHYDHTGSAVKLREATGARLVAHAEDAEYMAGRKRAPPPKGGMGVVFRLLVPLVRAAPFDVDIKVGEGDVVAGLTVLHVPGHTPGSIALLDPVRKALFAGDTLMFRDGEVQGPPVRFSTDPESARRSVERLKTLDFDTLLGGHGVPLTPGASARAKAMTW